ncbi:hypothetical protein C479_05408 [Halovivax asiaticus JCM 14624]|uniref:Uncharacterized protein n=2 Tax=Halovivax asiaticus TaxID=332953 RepID=M0BR99_9EURY|nr:hypothetical protein C479_05408 [Halovivax asiaticus JCM 14624]
MLGDGGAEDETDDDGTDGGEPSGSDTAEDPSETRYELSRQSGQVVSDWLLPPEAVGVDSYDVEAFTPARLGTHRAELPAALTELADQMEYYVTGEQQAGDTWDSLGVIVSADYGWDDGTTIVARGAFDATHFERLVRSDELTHRGEYGELDVYEGDGNAVAFDRTTWVQTSANWPVETLEQTIDAAASDATRYADAHDSFDRLVAALPDADVLKILDGAPAIRLMDIEGAVAKSEGYAVDGAETTATEAILFEDETDATTEAGKTYLDAHRLRPAPDHESVAITVDGQLLVVESAIDTGDVPKIGAM